MGSFEDRQRGSLEREKWERLLLILTVNPPPPKKSSIFPALHTLFSISCSLSGTNHLAATVMGLATTLLLPPYLLLFLPLLFIPLFFKFILEFVEPLLENTSSSCHWKAFNKVTRELMNCTNSHRAPVTSLGYLTLKRLPDISLCGCFLSAWKPQRNAE